MVNIPLAELRLDERYVLDEVYLQSILKVRDI